MNARYLHLNTKTMNKNDFMVINGVAKATNFICVNKVTITGDFTDFIGSTAIQISKFYFQSMKYNIQFYYINNVFYIDITNIYDFFDTVEVFDLMTDFFHLQDIKVQITYENNLKLIKLPFLKVSLDFYTIDCLFLVKKKNSY